MKEPQDVAVARRDPVVLDCQARGEAPVTVTWLKNGGKVSENERVYTLSNGSLYIREVEGKKGELSDEGFYQCLALNKYGAILSQKSHLTLASKFQLVFINLRLRLSQQFPEQRAATCRFDCAPEKQRASQRSGTSVSFSVFGDYEQNLRWPLSESLVWQEWRRHLRGLWGGCALWGGGARRCPVCGGARCAAVPWVAGGAEPCRQPAAGGRRLSQVLFRRLYKRYPLIW